MHARGGGLTRPAWAIEPGVRRVPDLAEWNLNVLTFEDADGIESNPGPQTVIEAGMDLLVHGRLEDLERFRSDTA